MHVTELHHPELLEPESVSPRHLSLSLWLTFIETNVCDVYYCLLPIREYIELVTKRCLFHKRKNHHGVAQIYIFSEFRSRVMIYVWHSILFANILGGGHRPFHSPRAHPLRLGSYKWNISSLVKTVWISTGPVIPRFSATPNMYLYQPIIQPQHHSAGGDVSC